MKELLALVTIAVVSFFLDSSAQVPQAKDGQVVVINKENPASVLSARKDVLVF